MLARLTNHWPVRPRSGPILAALLIVTAACQPAPPAEPTLEQRFQAELEALHSEYGFPGATAAYVLQDGTVGVAATGWSDVEAETAMTPQSRMLAASIGKSFVAATALALANEGLLNLDDPISTWLGDRDWFVRLPNHQTITLRHLLTHSAGLQDHVYTEAFAEALSENWRDTDNPLRPEALVAFVLDQPPLFEAGEGWSYTDTGYILVGLIIETVTPGSYYDEVAERFLVPLDLSLTAPSNEIRLPGLAAGYTAPGHPAGIPEKTTAGPGELVWNPAVEWTGGGLVSNPRDLALWAKALFEGRSMESPYLDDLLDGAPVGGDESGVHYGTGVALIDDTPFGPSWGHGGGIPGYSSSMRYFPDSGIAIAFQINTDIEAPDETTSVVEEMERRLTELVISATGN